MKKFNNSKLKILAYFMIIVLLSIQVSCAGSMKKREEAKHQLPKAKIVSTINTPESFNNGIALVKDNIWVLNSKQKMLSKIDVKSKKLVESIKIELGSPKGLAWDGKHFWIIDNASKIVHQIDQSNGKIVSSLKVPINGDEESVVLEAVAWDGKNLWVAYYAGYSSRIQKMDIETGEVLQSMFANSHPKGITTDGKYLWTVCYNRGKNTGVISQREIMDDVNMMNASRIFISKTPGKEPTGITFDGKYLWLSDKNMKMVHKIEILHR